MPPIDYILDENKVPLYFDSNKIYDDSVRTQIPTFQDLNIYKDFKIPPRAPNLFYKDFGLLFHPRLKDPKTRRPLLIKNLTEYQIRWWNAKGDIATPKANKVGLTTTSGLELFQSRLLPEEAGSDALWIAQNQRMANEHVLNLKNQIRWSKKYSQFLITRPDIELFREEKSKASVIYVGNPYDPKRPSRIIAIGGSESLAYSWKYVNRVHGSDISLLKSKDQKAFFAGLYSRLANTEGPVKFESVPNGQHGEFWNIINKSRYKKNVESSDEDFAEDPENRAGDFKVWDIPYTEAVSAGVITDAFIQKQRSRLGELLFSQLFECNFLPPGNQWYKAEWFKSERYVVGW